MVSNNRAQREDQVVASSQSINNFATLPTAADRRQLTFIQLESDAAR